MQETRLGRIGEEQAIKPSRLVMY